MSQEVDFSVLLQSLSTCNRVELSISPDIPRKEHYFKFLDHQIFDTLTGKVLILNLEDVETKTKVSVNYSDIRTFEINDHSNSSMHKFYITCDSRKSLFNYQDLLKRKTAGFDVDEKRLHDLSQASWMTYRIITLFN